MRRSLRPAGMVDRSSRPRSGPHGARTPEPGGHAFLHHAVDDHSRYAHSEVLTDETKTTATAFTTRAVAHPTSIGVTITRALTDDGSCHRSGDFTQLPSDNGIRHKRTHPHRPQTNGKAERFNRAPNPAGQNT